MELKSKSRFSAGTTFLKVVTGRLLATVLPTKNQKPIILIGGSLGEKYEDNAAAFHQYLLENWQHTYEVHWMYDREMSYVREKGIVNAVALGSLRNYILFFQAAHTIHGHSLMYDIAPEIDKYIHWNKKTTMTHISHGIECFKKILIQPEDVPLLERCDYFNCVSEYEKRIKRDEWGIPEEKLIITGMARFDRLPYNQPPPKVKSILMMMTWRETLMDLSEEEFKASEYFKATEELLKDKLLISHLESHDVQLNVVLHPFMKRFESYFKTLSKGKSQIEFYTFDEISIREQVLQSDALITDYSSIVWDFIYMNKPVIFYTFDQEAFLKMRGSYLDLDHDLLGYKANVKEEVVEAVETIVVEGKTANPRFSEMSDYIDFTDGKNCKRLANTLFTA
ncbi:CDP-glycerol glycerophosphotransferase family protein [Sporosarcina aquimarina]|uniref:CDP-glycerol glycerophosphotransferase family protein n=1 Tax=Sporosarcina aquimarina TaxID=114975 RepID=A0ABU4G2W7_9BACL|nr:CDP-glycerol glycerophosphotransferase family protein [Sporosarcina aquimarina]MDW0110648.1 CDP-glycerol glycerophosphotransferase family protein [Sporosarcina aquimarina]